MPADQRRSATLVIRQKLKKATARHRTCFHLAWDDEAMRLLIAKGTIVPRSAHMVEDAARVIDSYAFSPRDSLSEEAKASRQANARHKAIAVLEIYTKADAQIQLAEVLANQIQLVDALIYTRRQVRKLLQFLDTIVINPHEWPWPDDES